MNVSTLLADPLPPLIGLPARAGTTRTATRVVLALLLLLGILAVLPWVQTSRGEGRVVAYSPADRQQSLEAPIEGRITKWHVREGDWVEAGAVIAEISDNDPDIVARMRVERDATKRRLEAAELRVESLELRVTALEGSRKAALAAASYRVKMAGDRLVAAKNAVTAAGAAEATAKVNKARTDKLGATGVASARQVELADLDEVRAETEADRARAAEALANSDQLAFESDKLKIDADTGAAIADAKASLASSKIDVANAQAEIARIDVRPARQSAQTIVAPRSGTVTRIVARGVGGEVVKAGDLVAIFVPGMTDRAVELWVDGNDAPLLGKGSAVRLQFEGWPALQFAGWPKLAAGTFSGEVAFVEAADDGSGKTRVLVVPSPGAPWPSPALLRQGVRAQGWVRLGRVTTGYEVWRVLNGFPAATPPLDPATATTSKATREKKESGK
jgi:adhesin transport system membrane fusion protein